MRENDFAPINATTDAFDYEEFTRQELEDAGVKINYDDMRSNKKAAKANKFKYFMLLLLAFFLLIIVLVGYACMNNDGDSLAFDHQAIADYTTLNALSYLPEDILN